MPTVCKSSLVSVNHQVHGKLMIALRIRQTHPGSHCRQCLHVEGMKYCRPVKCIHAQVDCLFHPVSPSSTDVPVDLTQGNRQDGSSSLWRLSDRRKSRYAVLVAPRKSTQWTIFHQEVVNPHERAMCGVSWMIPGSPVLDISYDVGGALRFWHESVPILSLSQRSGAYLWFRITWYWSCRVSSGFLTASSCGFPLPKNPVLHFLAGLQTAACWLS